MGEGRTHVALNELGQVDVPDLERDGEREEVDSSLVHLETLLEVLLLFEEGSVVDDDLGDNQGEGQPLSLGAEDFSEEERRTWALAIRSSRMRS